MDISTKYDPSEVEAKWYDYWIKNRFFHSEPDERDPFTIVIPPPNVTGVLHMGHMLNNTIQDILVRRARMMGKNACWVPGTDHASIATEAKVVAKLTSEGIKKTDLTREQFLEHAWEWTRKHGGIILEQLKKLGCSCDWDRTAFTMDEVRSKSVIKVFCDLYEKGLIYRGVRMVNWDPKALTALSDEEVNYKEQHGKLYYIRYQVVAPPSPPEGGDVIDLHDKYGYLTANTPNYGLLKEFAQNMRRFSTEAESALLEMLRRKNLDARFRRQHIIGDFIADFVCLRKKIIIEVDGKYHNDPNVAEYDKIRTQILNDLGFNIVRFSNEEVIGNSINVLERIKNALAQTPPPSGGLGGAYAIVATTRPETIFGDTAMCINPNNPKTAWLKGKKVLVPFIDREIPVIEDEYVDMEFGTGCLKVTPAHDVNDYMLGQKNNLPSIDIFNDNGTLNEYGAMYAGMDRFEVRKKMEKDLETAGLLEKMEPYTNKVGFSERTDVPIEPKLSMQWFLKMEDLAKPALEAVENDTIKFYPDKFKNTYRHWMTNIKDWNISRQLWWGHQIPAYYVAPSNSPEGGEQFPSFGGVRGGSFVVAENKELARVKAIEKFPELKDCDFDLKQDEDVLDTWFSSWLWPISVFDGINNPDNKDIDYYYPTNDLITAPEIIFFWVARMIMAGYECRQKPCFYNVYFNGIVRDKLGRKMSKSLGNSPDPIELMNKYGADGVRMGMLLTSPAGNDLPFDEALCEQGRNFNNKIWNAFRLVKGWEVEKFETPSENFVADTWFKQLLEKTKKELDDLFLKYRLSEALTLIYKVFWDDFCAWYLEIIKPEYGKPIDEMTLVSTKNYFKELLKLLHPFIPFITEELWQALEERKPGESIMVSSLHFSKDCHCELNPQSQEQTALQEIDVMNDVKEIVTNIRNIRASKSISPKEKLNLQISGEHNDLFKEVIIKLANVEIENVTEKSAGAVSFMVNTTEYAVPVGNLINVEEELAKLQEELKYQQGFLDSVLNKLSNENFVSKAPVKVIEMERKKQADAESKIKTLQESIKELRIEN